MAKRWLMLLIEVHEELFPKGDVYNRIPDELNTRVTELLPNDALSLDSVHLVDLKNKRRLTATADKYAINYHHYAVSIRGEKCEEANCEQHPIHNVLSLHDHKHRNTPSPGVN